MTLTARERAALRAEAHHLTPLVRVGQQGLTPTVVQSLNDVLRVRELVKVQLGRGADLNAGEAAGLLAEACGADVVQVIGHTATLYRENPDLPKPPEAPPAWRR